MRRIILFLFAVFVVAAWTLPSYAAETTFNGTWRVRAHAFENQNDFNDNAGATQTYWDQRFRLGITSRASDDFGGFWEIQTDDNDATDSNYDWNYSAMGVSTNQAYLDFNVANVNIKIGKQDFVIPGDIHNLVAIDTFDALIAATQVGPATVYGGFIKVSEADDETANAQSDDDRNVFALGAQFMPTEGVDAGAFWAFDRNGSTEVSTHYLGANGSFAAGPVNLALEGVIRSGQTDTGAATDVDYKGWVFAADANMAPNDMFTIGLGLGIGSGDDNPTDYDDEQFDGIAPSHNATRIYFDGGDGAWSNGTGALVSGTGELGGVTYVKPYVKAKVNDQINLMGQFAWLKYTQQEDSRRCGQSDTGGSACTASDDELGTEINLQGDYTLHTASSLTLSLYANWFFPGDGVRLTSETTDDAVSEYLAKVQYDF